MLIAVDPLLQRIEAVPEPDCYSVTFLLDGAHERSVIMKVTGSGDGAERIVQVPEANLIPGWSATSGSFRAVLAAVRAVDDARHETEDEPSLLRDQDGGWDVSVGNVVLGASGQPECVAHGELELVGSATYRCATCGAEALFGRTGPATGAPGATN
jgi:hypothetical protein